MIKWSKVRQSKDQSGLGIGPLKEMNRVLLGKSLWRLGDEADSLWKKVLFSKYVVFRGGWGTKTPLPCYSGVWRHLFSSVKGVFFWNIRFPVGRGDTILFWLDIWVGDTSLATRFSELFCCAQNKKVAVADYMDRVGDQAVWGPIFRRNFTDIEPQFQALLSYLGNVTNVYIPMDGKDRLMDIFQLALPLIL